MELAQPGNLAWLLLLPVLYLLSRPPRPRRTRSTAHLVQWMQAQKRLRRRPVRFQTLRFLLLAAALLAIVFAHAALELPGKPGPTSLVVLADASASMSAGSEDRTTWDGLRREIGAVLAEVPEHIDVRIGLCADGVRVLRGSRRELLATLALVDPAGPGRVDMSAMAADLMDADTAVWTLTDGLGPTQPSEVGALTILGGDANNLGITAVDIEDGWPLPQVRLSVRVGNFGRTSATTEVRLEGGIETTAGQSIPLAPGEERRVEFAVVRSGGGRLTIRLVGTRDALSGDDRVEVELPPPPRPEIVVRGSGTASRALLAVAHALAAECGGRVVEDSEASEAGFLLLEGGVVAQVPRGVRMLSFGTALGEGLSPSPAAPRVVEWDRQQPITSDLDLSELRVTSAVSWPEDHGGVPLIHGADGPLALLFPGDESASVHLAFELEDSNFFKLAAFPQFVRRSFAQAYGRKAVPQIVSGALLDPSESRLIRQGPQVAERPLPQFAVLSTALAVPLLLLALLFLAIRTYV